MNIYIKTFAITASSLFLTCCEQDPQPYPYTRLVYDEAIRLNKLGNLNDAVFHYQLTALDCFCKEDSLVYWWKAMCGQGNIWLQKNFLSYAQSDFENVLNFAQEQQLDTVEYLACRTLCHIALEQHRYNEAYSYAIRTKGLSQHNSYPKELTQGQDDEFTLSQAAYATMNGKPVTATAYHSLEKIAANNPKISYRIAALRLLSLCELQTSGLPTRTAARIDSLDKCWNDRFQLFTEEAEREKKQLIAERDEIAATQRHTLFISITLMSLLLCGGVFAIANYRRKHELDNIRLILKQKEETILQLELNQENLETLHKQLREKEEQMKELEQQKRMLKELQQSVVSQNEEQLSTITKLTDEINNLSAQLKQKQQQREKMETQIRYSAFYNTVIGKKIPSPDNPFSPGKEIYRNLFYESEENIMSMLRATDKHFKRFASGLQYLNPNLSMHEILLCCLFRLNVRVTDIALMLNVTKSAVSKRRTRLEFKMNEPERLGIKWRGNRMATIVPWENEQETSNHQ